jgi:mannose/fructose/N-acetylgalactosamine-specific phosphotransferase system component IIC
MVNKILGYILALVGILAMASTSFNKIREFASVPEAATTSMLLIGGGILVAIGILILYKSSSKKALQEVPIYKDKQIVGYRRH